jgi:mRNA-degrading endonuclease YafQ of YafQ-DinJ toxin-antitoxin module
MKKIKMYFELAPTKLFGKKLKKLLTKNKLLKKVVTTVFVNLQINPFIPQLKSHKVNTPKFAECYSSRVTGDLRVIWRFGDDGEIVMIELLDIGGHDEVY